MTIDMIFSGLFQLVAAGGGGALVAYGLFQFLGKCWIENQLAKNLELAKSEISLLAARKMKLHDREYIVFPEVWSKLNMAISSLGAAVLASRQTQDRQTPDFSGMTDHELQGWVDRSDIVGKEKAYFLVEEDKRNAYNCILDWRLLLKAQHDFEEFSSYLQCNRIFLSPEIKERLDHIGNLINESLISKKLHSEGCGPSAGKSLLTEAYEKYEKQAKPVMTEIEALVQGKLFPESTV